MPAATAHRAASAGGSRRRGSSGNRTSGSLRASVGGCYRGVGADSTGGPLGPRADGERRGALRGPPSSQRQGPGIRVRGLRAAAAAATSTPDKAAASSAAADTPRRSRASVRQQASRSRVGPAAAAAAAAGLDELTGAAVESPVGPPRRSSRRNQATQAAEERAAAAAAAAEPDSREARALPRRERKLRGAEALRSKFSRFSTSDEDLRDQLCGCCLDGLLPGEEAEEPVGVASSDERGAEASKQKTRKSNARGGPPHGGPPKKESPPPPPPLARIDACDHCFHLRCIQPATQQQQQQQQQEAAAVLTVGGDRLVRTERLGRQRSLADVNGAGRGGPPVGGPLWGAPQSIKPEAIMHGGPHLCRGPLDRMHVAVGMIKTVARRTAEFFQRRVDALYAPDDTPHQQPQQQQQQQRESSAAAAACPPAVSSSGENHSPGSKSSGAAAAAAAAARRRMLTPVIVPLAAVHGIGGSRDRGGGPQRRRGGGPPSSGPSFNLRPNYAEDFLVRTGDGINSRRGSTAQAGRAL
ncbi:hypothetical protein Emag_000627 [Eimeria magna]